MSAIENITTMILPVSVSFVHFVHSVVALR
jgi:hypothetical protein